MIGDSCDSACLSNHVLVGNSCIHDVCVSAASHMKQPNSHDTLPQHHANLSFQFCFIVDFQIWFLIAWLANTILSRYHVMYQTWDRMLLFPSIVLYTWMQLRWFFDCPEKLTRIVQKGYRKSEEISGSTPKVSGVYSGPCFMEVRSVVLV